MSASSCTSMVMSASSIFSITTSAMISPPRIPGTVMIGRVGQCMPYRLAPRAPETEGHEGGDDDLDILLDGLIRSIERGTHGDPFIGDPVRGPRRDAGSSRGC